MDNLVLQAITNYYLVLEKTGYVKQPEVNKLLLLSFIDDVLNNFEGLVTEDDYNTLMKIVSCIANNTCFVPAKNNQLPSFVVYRQQFMRKTEEDSMRNTLQSDYRLVNY